MGKVKEGGREEEEEDWGKGEWGKEEGEGREGREGVHSVQTSKFTHTCFLFDFLVVLCLFPLHFLPCFEYLSGCGRRLHKEITKGGLLARH